MHFALPPRHSSAFKSSSSYNSRSSYRSPTFRRKQIKTIALVLLGILGVYYALSWVFAGSVVDDDDFKDDEALGSIPPGTPEVVVVTVLDKEKMSADYVTKIRENRADYAKRHGYATYFTDVADYKASIGNYPSSWSLVPATRKAMTEFPKSRYFFVLSAHSLIMNPSLSLAKHILNPTRLDELMLKDIPVVPPDSVIHTFSHRKAEKIDLVLTQDADSLCPYSFIIKRGDWAKYFLDAWFDPLYRSYNFAKAEGHALEHIVQWHPTLLAKLALIPQRILNAYNIDLPDDNGRGVYQEEDFVVRLAGCEWDSNRVCEQEFMPFYKTWKARWVDGSGNREGRSFRS